MRERFCSLGERLNYLGEREKSALDYIFGSLGGEWLTPFMVFSLGASWGFLNTIKIADILSVPLYCS